MFSPTVVLTALTVASVACSEIKPQMFNGEQIFDGEFKFLVQLSLEYSTGSKSCSGSIVDANWIITAAHCVSDHGEIRAIKVTRLGNAPVRTPITVSNIVRHPEYRPSADSSQVLVSSMRFDLALLCTTQPIQLNQHVQAIPLGRYPAEGEAIVVGYGEPEHAARKGRMVLSTCAGGVLCSVRSGNMARIGRGDSGGPVVANGVLVGVVSSASSFSEEWNLQNFFADVASSYEWIQSVINS